MIIIADAVAQLEEEWFAGHPDAKYFEPSLQETYADTKPEEWIWYFWEHLKIAP